MKKGKFEGRKRFAFGKKALVLVLALTLLLGGVIGGTIAWLVDTTPSITNVFTTSHVKLSLTETGISDGNRTNEYKMIPGYTITKDPTIKVLTGSEDCLVFVKIEAKNNANTYLSYTMAEGWTALTGETGVYYRTTKATAGDTLQVFKDNKVTVSDEMTEANMAAIDSDSKPEYVITAYGVQYYTDGSTAIDPATAWGTINS